MKHIYAKDTSGLLRKIAKCVWEKIIFNHAVTTEVSEIGLTNDIVANIKHFATLDRNIDTIGIWANNAYLEKDWGSDIDIFVEIEKGKYVWNALQAKVLKIHGGYDDICTKKGGYFQWEKLEQLRERTKCMTKYLLYNGREEFSYRGKDSCMHRFQEHQFGCSLVEIKDIKNACLSNGNKTKFEDFHPNKAQPWRILLSYAANEKDTILLTPMQIKRASEHYPMHITRDNFSFAEEELYEFHTSNAPDIVNESNSQIERTPKYLMVIKKEESPNEMSSAPNNLLAESQKNINIPINFESEREPVNKSK